jgi:hypothetical protein
MPPSVDPEIAQWQSEEREIGMIEFAPTKVATERFPYYPLPKFSVFLGIMEVDALCLADDGSLCVYDNEVQNRIICRAAKNQSSFVAAMKELDQHFEKCVADDSYCDDVDAAALVRDKCSQIAGGDEYVSFFTSLLGV